MNLHDELPWKWQHPETATYLKYCISQGHVIDELVRDFGLHRLWKLFFGKRFLRIDIRLYFLWLMKSTEHEICFLILLSLQIEKETHMPLFSLFSVSPTCINLWGVGDFGRNTMDMVINRLFWKNTFFTPKLVDHFWRHSLRLMYMYIFGYCPHGLDIFCQPAGPLTQLFA